MVQLPWHSLATTNFQFSRFNFCTFHQGHKDFISLKESNMHRILNLSGNQILRRRTSVVRHITKAAEAHQNSIANPTAFWGAAAQDIVWKRPPTSILNTKEFPHGRWFEGGELNTSYNCIDRHVEAGLGEQTAIIHDSPVTNSIRKLTYNELLEETIRAASVLRGLGVQKGDRVVIYMPNIPEAIVAMQACARIGAIHSVVFGGFADVELATRIKDSKPKVVIASSCGIEGSKVIDYKKLLDSALDLASSEHVVQNCLILQRPQRSVPLIPGRDIDLRQAMDASAQVHDPRRAEVTYVKADDPLYILYTSGTTGKPKGVLRDNGGHAVALKWAMKNVYNVKQGDVFWAASDVGWVVGHSFSVYGPLLAGLTTVLYEGKPVGTPDAVNFWRTIERHRVNVLFTAPTAIRGIKAQDEHGAQTKDFDLTTLRALFLAGERADTASIKWAEHALKVPVLDHWWQTETGWPITGNIVGLDGYVPVKYGSAFPAVPGYDVKILNDAHEDVPPNTQGSIVIKLPLPPGTLLSLYDNHERFEESYMKNVPGYYDTGDAGLIDEEGYVFVMSRTDDVLNVAGHRLSSGAMEEVISDHDDVAEVAVVGVKDALKGQTPLGLLVLNSHCERSHEEIVQEVIKMVRDRIGPVAAFKQAVVVERLPKTRSGKVLRATMRAIADGQDFKMPATIEDPAVLEEVAEVIKKYISTHKE